MEWNVIVSANEHGYKPVRHLLTDFGRVRSTDYFNVLALQVDDIERFLEAVRALYAMHDRDILQVGRIVPVTHRFRFMDAAGFESQAQAVAVGWLQELAGRRFYVRMHRRGFKGRLSSSEEERFLDGYILAQLQSHGLPAAAVDFAEPQRVIAIETLGTEAGMSLWTREQLQRYPFLKLN